MTGEPTPRCERIWSDLAWGWHRAGLPHVCLLADRHPGNCVCHCGDIWRPVRLTLSAD
jgi:hypothetical protein